MQKILNIQKQKLGILIKNNRVDLQIEKARYDISTRTKLAQNVEVPLKASETDIHPYRTRVAMPDRFTH